MKHFVLKYFRTLGFLEGSSLLALMFIAMPAKRVFGYPELTTLIGAVHGVLFLAYVYTLISAKRVLNLKASTAFVAFVLASIPFGTFWFDRKYLSKVEQ